MAVAVTRSVNCKIISVGTPAREGTSFRFKWSLQGAVYNENNNGRAEWLDAELCFQSSDLDSKKKAKPLKVLERRNQHAFPLSKLTGHDRIWCRDYGNRWTEITQAYNRNLYHPIKPNRFLRNVYANVWLGNKYGDKKSILTSPVYSFLPPKAPSMDTPAISADGGNQRISTTIKNDTAADRQEYYDTMYCYTRTDNFSPAYKKERIISNGGKWVQSGARAAEISPGVDMADSLSLGTGDWIKITFKAYARGICGNSSTTERSHIFAYPATPTILGIEASSYWPNTVIVIRIATNSSTYSPVDEVVLERALTGDEVTSYADIPQSSWTEAAGGVKDNANCMGFSEQLADTGLVIFDENGHATGNRLWYRVRAKHDTLVTYSLPIEARVLHKTKYVPVPSQCEIMSVENVSGEDAGTTCLLHVEWPVEQGRNMTDTEISWSSYEHAWDSTEPPTTHVVATAENVHGRYGTSLYIRGLEEGVKYYFRARRHGQDSEGADIYDQYSEPYEFVPAGEITNLKLTGPESVERGKSIRLNWTYDGPDIEDWGVFFIRNPTTYQWGRAKIAEGTDPMGAAVVQYRKKPDDVPDVVETQYSPWWDNRESVDLLVIARGNGDYVESNVWTVMFKDAPVLYLDVPSEATAQPFGFSVMSDSQDVDIVAKVVSKGMVTNVPEGKMYQADGDVVWGDVLHFDSRAVHDETQKDPWWEYKQDFEVPAGTWLVDGAVYDVVAVAIDRSTGATSEPVTASFSVDYDHKAVEPSLATYLQTMENAKFVTMKLVAGDGSDESDVADIYRVTPDGVYQIASNVGFGSTVTDRFAPYSKKIPLYYRIASRAENGTVAWRDFRYVSAGFHIRFDWGDGEFLELPYNIKYTDSWSKSFDAREHLDAPKPTGFWDSMVKRSSTLSTEIVRIDDPDTLRKIKSLAQYPGCVFVRTPDGSAYSANVELSSMDNTFNSLTQSVSFKATEVTLAEGFMVGSNDIEPPEEV